MLLLLLFLFLSVLILLAHLKTVDMCYCEDEIIVKGLEESE